MIKKIIGVVVAVAVIVIILVVALHRNRYASMVFDHTEPEAVYEAQVGDRGEGIPAGIDSLGWSDTVALEPAPAAVSTPAEAPAQ